MQRFPLILMATDPKIERKSLNVGVAIGIGLEIASPSVIAKCDSEDFMRHRAVMRMRGRL